MATGGMELDVLGASFEVDLSSRVFGAELLADVLKSSTHVLQGLGDASVSTPCAQRVCAAVRALFSRSVAFMKRQDSEDMREVELSVVLEICDQLLDLTLVLLAASHPGLRPHVLTHLERSEARAAAPVHTQAVRLAAVLAAVCRPGGRPEAVERCIEAYRASVLDTHLEAIEGSGGPWGVACAARTQWWHLMHTLLHGLPSDEVGEELEELRMWIVRVGPSAVRRRHTPREQGQVLWPSADLKACTQQHAADLSASLTGPADGRVSVVWREQREALRRGGLLQVSPFRCPVSGAAFELHGPLLPTRLRPCGHRACRGIAAARENCPACSTALDALCPFKVDKKVVRLMQALAEVHVIDAESVELNDLLEKGGCKDVFAGVWRQPCGANTDVRVSVVPVEYDVVENVREVVQLVAMAQLAGGAGRTVCRLRGVCWQDGSVWMVQEAGRRTLKGVLEEARTQCGVKGAAPAARGGLPPTDVALLIHEMSSACLAVRAHADVVHRDLHPENVAVVDGHVRILNFGVAEQLEAMTTVGSRASTSAGAGVAPNLNLFYCAPELVQPDIPPATSMDVYAIGATALFALTGERPFRSTQEWLTAIHVRGGGIRVPAPCAGASEAVVDLHRLIREMVRVECDRRPSTLQEVHLRALRICQELARVQGPKWFKSSTLSTDVGVEDSLRGTRADAAKQAWGLGADRGGHSERSNDCAAPLASDAQAQHGMGETNADTVLHSFDLQPSQLGALPGWLLLGPQTATRLDEITRLHISTDAHGVRTADLGSVASGLPALRQLQLLHHDLGCRGVRQLVPGATASNITVLHLIRTNLGDDGLAELLRVIPLSRLSELRLDGNRLGDYGAVRLARALQVEQGDMVLRHLSLACNCVSAAVARALGQALWKLPELEVADLSGNALEGLGVSELLRAFQVPDRLKQVFLVGNRLGRGAAAGVPAEWTERVVVSGRGSFGQELDAAKLKTVKDVADSVQPWPSSNWPSSKSKLLEHEQEMQKFLTHLKLALLAIPDYRCGPSVHEDVASTLLMRALARVGTYLRRASERQVQPVSTTRHEVALRELRSFLLLLCVLLTCVLVPTALRRVQLLLHRLLASHDFAADAPVAAQLKNLLELFQGVPDLYDRQDSGVSSYEFQLLISIVHGRVLRLQLDWQEWVKWQGISEQIAACMPTGQLREHLKEMLEVSRVLDHVQDATLLPVQQSLVALSHADLQGAFALDDLQKMQVLRCPITNCAFDVLGGATPVIMRQCGCTVSRRAANGSVTVGRCRAPHCPLARNRKPGPLPQPAYHTDMQLIRLLLAIAEVGAVDPSEVEAGEHVGSGGQASVREGWWRGRHVAIREVPVQYHNEQELQQHVRSIATWKLAEQCSLQVNELLAVMWLPDRLWMVHQFCETGVEQVVLEEGESRGGGVGCEQEYGASFWAVPRTCGCTPNAVVPSRACAWSHHVGLPASDVALLVLELATATACMYALANIVHCDLTPDNLLLVGRDEHRRLSIIDFGIAALVATWYSRDGRWQDKPSVPGKICYAAPEQGGEPGWEDPDTDTDAVAPSMDVYSIGSTAIFCATGQVPFAGDSSVALYSLHVQKVPMNVPDCLPRNLVELLQEMVMLQPHERPTVRQVVQRSLDVLREQKGLKATFVCSHTWS